MPLSSFNVVQTRLIQSDDYKIVTQTQLRFQQLFSVSLSDIYLFFFGFCITVQCTRGDKLQLLM